MASAKQSKNSRTSKKKVVEYIKPIKPRKETILVELTPETMCEIYKTMNPESGLAETYRDKKILGIVEKYGKRYLKVDNR